MLPGAGRMSANILDGFHLASRQELLYQISLTRKHPVPIGGRCGKQVCSFPPPVSFQLIWSLYQVEDKCVKLQPY